MLAFIVVLLLVTQQFVIVEHASATFPRATVAQPLSSLSPSPPLLPLSPLSPTPLLPYRPTLSSGLDLERRYAPEGAYWSTFAAGRKRSASWLVALRREMLAAANSSYLPRVSHRIHQSWKDEDPPRVLFSPRWASSLRQHNPRWKYRLWTDADNRRLVASHYPDLLSMYDGYKSPIQRADMARYVVAHVHGGMYADLDTECFESFEPLARGASLLLSYKVGGNFSRGACNSIFGKIGRAHV